MPQYITDNIELFSDSNRNDCNKEILIKKISIKETRCRILEYHAGFKRFMKYSHNLRNSYNEVNF